MAALVQFIVMTAATIVSAAAVYVARQVHQISEKIDENEQRSKRNRQYMMGDPPTGRSLLDRIRDLERKRGNK